MTEIEMLALLKSINIKIEALQAQIMMFQEALQPHREHTRMEEEVEKSFPKKLPKSTKKIDSETHKISGTTCNQCGGLISWDGYDKSDPTPPLHVNADGIIINDGQCPEWEAEQ